MSVTCVELMDIEEWRRCSRPATVTLADDSHQWSYCTQHAQRATKSTFVFLRAWPANGSAPPVAAAIIDRVQQREMPAPVLIASAQLPGHKEGTQVRIYQYEIGNGEIEYTVNEYAPGTEQGYGYCYYVGFLPYAWADFLARLNNPHED